MTRPSVRDKLRVVCISDTHTRLERYPERVPSGDILLHAGDFTKHGLPIEVKQFNDFLGSMPHRVKVVIAGNHDLTFDDDLVKNRRDFLEHNFNINEDVFERKLAEFGVNTCKELLTNCVYLEDASVSVCGLNIYGSPWQPQFPNWGFYLSRGEACLQKWNLIPDDTDILITHGPPIGHGDASFFLRNRAGCVELLSTIQQRVQPKYHVFGHIHRGYGITTDDVTTFINASTCTMLFRPNNPPIVFDIPLPTGHTKDELASVQPCRLTRPL
ncbi:hypothetical protein DPMN_044900 [Dreissena polymorpha]|uniref:Calcineurin-like phosphoesterase domain-containing protein n=1 Tax=Dreissena polymorpha TaxID=45954 RepID=A0A9D4D4Z4_DREPO|nr:hypothetical protein DPMN_044900 [Dreissena polymorpha]